MSYILDALRRAETERQRGAVPGLHAQAMATSLAEPVSVSRRGPGALLWAGGAGLLLALGATAWWLTAAPVPVVQVAPAHPLPGALPNLPPPAVQVSPAPQGQQAASLAEQAQQAQQAGLAPASSPSSDAPPPVRPALPVGAAPLGPAPAPVNTPGAARTLAPTLPALPQRAALPPPLLTPPPLSTLPTLPTQPDGPLTAVPAPAPPAPALAPAPAPAPARLPTLAELPEAQRRELPPLAVGGAVFAELPAQRIVILNGQVFHEGDRVAPDLLVQQIRLKSVVLAWRGQRFELPL